MQLSESQERRIDVDGGNPVNIYRVTVFTESGCDVDKGEYSINIITIIQGEIAKEDFGLVEDCMAEVVGDMPEEAVMEFTVTETGEREDVFWHKWYEVTEGPGPNLMGTECATAAPAGQSVTADVKENTIPACGDKPGETGNSAVAGTSPERSRAKKLHDR